MPSGRPVFRNVWLKAWLSVFSVPLFIQSISSPNRPTCYQDNLIWSLLQTFQRWILRGCVHMGRSSLGSVIRCHSDHDTSKKSFNPFPGCIRQFLWRAMIRVTSDYWSWSESPHWTIRSLTRLRIMLRYQDRFSWSIIDALRRCRSITTT